jgi:aspartate aminotransferase
MDRRFSERITSLSPSPTLALNSKAAELAANGKKVFNLTIGEPDFPTPTEVVDVAIDSLRRGRTKYGSAGGGKALRDAIAEKLLRDNRLQFAADEIVCGPGAKSILFHTFLAILNDGDEVLIPAPYWVSYCDQIKAAGAVPVVIPPATGFSESGNHDGHPIIDFSALERSIGLKTRAIVVNSPNNPAGYVFSRDEIEHLAAFVLKHDLWLISDEIYEYMAFDRPHISPLEVCPDLRPRFILINGLSKGFAMTGWRVGFAAGPKDVISLVRVLESHSTTCIPGFIEDAATHALKRGKQMMSEAITSLDRRRKITIDALSGFSFVHPAGAFYVFLDVRDLCTGGITSINLCEDLLQAGLALVPGEAFGMPGYLRLSYTLSDDDLRAALKILTQTLRDRGKQPPRKKDR